MMEKMGTERGMNLLAALSTSSAAAEIGLSPLIGGLADSLGRKPVLIGTLCSAVLANAAVALSPSVGIIAVSKFVSACVVGVFFLGAGAILADNYRTEPKRLAAASGIVRCRLPLAAFPCPSRLAVRAPVGCV